MRASNFVPVLLFLTALGPATLTGCGSDNPATDAGPTGDAGGGGDSGVDAGGGTDSGIDGGQDAGPSCTTGCAWVELALGLEHSCARRENGEVKCWGRGQDGEIGDDRERHFPTCPVEGGADVDCASRPQRVALAEPVTSISSRGGLSTCGLNAAGEVWCWGGEGFDIAGVPAAVRYAPEQFLDLTGIQSVADSYHTICFLASDGTPSCAGFNSTGQTGTGSFGPVLTPMPVVLADETDPMMTAGPLTDVIELDLATFFPGFGCARTSDTVYCWGSDEAGELGAPTLDRCVSGTAEWDCSDGAVAIAMTDLDGSAVAELALGSSHGCARMNDGTVRCWGQNNAGQLGTGGATQEEAPVEVPGLTGVAQLVAGGSHTCARMVDGTVRCWGSNSQGQIGDGSDEHGNCTIGTTVFDCVMTPTAVMGITDAAYIAAGRSHTCVIREGGAEVWCWGQNESLQLGDGPNTRPTPADRAPRYAPVMVEGL